MQALVHAIVFGAWAWVGRWLLLVEAALGPEASWREGTDSFASAAYVHSLAVMRSYLPRDHADRLS